MKNKRGGERVLGPARAPEHTSPRPTRRRRGRRSPRSRHLASARARRAARPDRRTKADNNRRPAIPARHARRAASADRAALRAAGRRTGRPTPSRSRSCRAASAGLRIAGNVSSTAKGGDRQPGPPSRAFSDAFPPTHRLRPRPSRCMTMTGFATVPVEIAIRRNSVRGAPKIDRRTQLSREPAMRRRTFLAALPLAAASGSLLARPPAGRAPRPPRRGGRAGALAAG